MKSIIRSLLVAVACMATSCSPQQEMLDMPVGTIDLSDLGDGIYPGYYENYRWFCEVEVEVVSKRIDTIEVLNAAAGGKKFYGELINRVIDNQSLQVDAVSGGTISSKTFLKAVEDALE